MSTGQLVGGAGGAIVGGLLSIVPGLNLFAPLAFNAFATGAIFGSTIGAYLMPEKVRQGEIRDTPSYGFGGNISIDPNAVVQVIYGKVRTGGVLLRAQVQAEDSHHEESIDMLLGFGEGPIGRGDLTTFEEFRVNDRQVVDFPDDSSEESSTTTFKKVSESSATGHPNREVPLGKQLYGIIRFGNDEETQKPIQEFQEIGNTVTVNEELTFEGGPVTYITRRPVTGFAVGISLPNGLYVNYTQKDGDLKFGKESFSIVIRYRKLGDTDWIVVKGNDKIAKHRGAINDSFQTSFGESGGSKNGNMFFGDRKQSRTALFYTFDLIDYDDVPRTAVQRIREEYRQKGGFLDQDFYEIEVTRAQVDTDSLNLPSRKNVTNNTVLSYITEKTYDTFNFPFTAQLGVFGIANESTSGRIPKVTAVVSGKRVLHLDQGVDSELAWTDNPAWIIADVIINKIYGLGNFYSTDDLDIDSFVAASEFCQELVKVDGKGWEPRAKFDFVVDSQYRAIDLISRIANSCRLLPVISNGKWRLVIDEDSPSSQSFTTEGKEPSINRESFEVASTPFKDIVNQIEIEFQNEDRAFENDSLVVEDLALLDSSVPRRRKIEMYGVTRSSQIRRIGTYLMKLQKLNKLIISFKCPMHALVSEAGDVIDVTNDDYGFDQKTFRIVDISHNPDFTTDITAREHNPNVYSEDKEGTISTRSDFLRFFRSITGFQDLSKQQKVLPQVRDIKATEL